MAEPLRPEFFRRFDEAEDEDFYRSPRPVVHIDDTAIATVGQIYLDHIAPGGKILDLMSSWRSHLPAPLRPSGVTGVGLNREEMEDNPALSAIVIHNVNREWRLPFEDGAFGAAVMTVSVQYLIHPVEIFREVGRVLRGGGPFIVTFSNRMFPTKAVALWQAADEGQRVTIVNRYFTEAGNFERITTIDRSRRPDSPGDPIWAVLGYSGVVESAS